MELEVVMRYRYLGDKLTDPALVGMQFDPVRDRRGKCIISVAMATALVMDAQGQRYIVLRRRLRLNEKCEQMELPIAMEG